MKYCKEKPSFKTISAIPVIQPFALSMLELVDRQRQTDTSEDFFQKKERTNKNKGEVCYILGHMSFPT